MKTSREKQSGTDQSDNIQVKQKYQSGDKKCGVRRMYQEKSSGGKTPNKQSGARIFRAYKLEVRVQDCW